MTCAPKSAAETFAMDPPNLPTAVRTAAVMTTSLMEPPSLLQYVLSGRIGERHIAGRGGSHRRGSHLLRRGVLRQPLFPRRPPRAGSRRRTVEPGLRRQGLRGIQPRTDTV